MKDTDPVKNVKTLKEPEERKAYYELLTAEGRIKERDKAFSRICLNTMINIEDCECFFYDY